MADRGVAFVGAWSFDSVSMKVSFTGGNREVPRARRVSAMSSMVSWAPGCNWGSKGGAKKEGRSEWACVWKTRYAFL